MRVTSRILSIFVTYRMFERSTQDATMNRTEIVLVLKWRHKNAVVCVSCFSRNFKQKKKCYRIRREIRPQCERAFFWHFNYIRVRGKPLKDIYVYIKFISLNLCVQFWVKKKIWKKIKKKKLNKRNFISMRNIFWLTWNTYTHKHINCEAWTRTTEKRHEEKKNLSRQTKRALILIIFVLPSMCELFL